MPTFWKADMETRLDQALEKQRAIDANWRLVCRQVTAREGSCCRVCGKRCNPSGSSFLSKGHHHHIVYRSAGGQDSVENVCLLDASCHDLVHVKKTLRIEGNAEEALTVWAMGEDGIWFVKKQEVSVGRWERD
jgi:5-methylcytosine-specific restriction endonuclease McrA